MTQPGNHGSVSGRLQAVYYVHQMELPEVVKHLAPFANEDSIRGTTRFLSAWGKSMEITPNFKPCAHYLAPLDSRFSRAFVLRAAVPLPVCPGLASVFGTMLTGMGPGAEIYVQSGRTWKKSSQWVTPEYLHETLPSARVEELTGGESGWIRLGWAPGVDRDVAKLDSVYSLLAHRFDEFSRVLVAAGHPNKKPDEAYFDSVENAFIYSQHWALETGGIFRKAVEHLNASRSMRGLDIGGSYGFLVCELAAQGHTMTNLELIDWRVERVLPWLGEACGVEDRVSGIAARMEDLDGEAESYDFICFMGSLLCCERSQVPDVLRKAMQLLKPGGFLFIRENLLLDVTKRTDGGSETRFTAAELNDALTAHAAAPIYFDHFGTERPFEEVKKRWTIYAVAQKGGAAAGGLSVPLTRAFNVLRRLVSR